MARGVIMEGTFVPEKFATGDYVLAAGADSPDIRTTPPVGSKVELGGREFEIMAALRMPCPGKRVSNVSIGI